MSEPQKPRHPLMTLFTTMLTISAFTFGGGFVIVSLMKKKLVDGLGWLSEEEMLDYTAMAQSCPGPIAVNAAILVGWRVAGLLGMLAAVAGTVIPPIAILAVISFFYERFASDPYVAAVLGGMQAGVAAVLADVVFSLGRGVIRGKDPVRIVMMFAAFLAACVLKVNVIAVILVAAVLGVVLQMAGRGRKA